MIDNNDKNTEPQPDALDEEALRRRLINRIALAGLAIVALLGGLAVIDMIYVEPATTAQKAAPKSTQTTLIADENGPGVVADPAENAVSVDSTTAPSPILPIQDAPEAPAPDANPVATMRGEPEESASPSIPIAPPPKQVSPTIPRFMPTTEAVSGATPVASTPSKAGPQFVVQMGVFNTVSNAQELLARLQKSGVPAQIEARVQVGPFRTKAEAEQANAKLKAMGLAPGILTTTHK